MFNDSTSVLNAVNTPYMGGETNTAEAFRVVHQMMFTPENGDRASADNVLVMITGGVSQNRCVSIRSEETRDVFRS
jgi:hypothetical protein